MKAKKKPKSVQTASFVKKGKGRWHIKGKKTKRKGQPLAAFRVYGPLLTAFVKKHGDKDTAWGALRAFMSRTTGVSQHESEE